MKKPKHAKGPSAHNRVSNLGAFAHPPKTSGNMTRVGPLPNQLGRASDKMAGKPVSPASVSKPRMRRV